jgi:hypothetical protein
LLKLAYWFISNTYYRKLKTMMLNKTVDMTQANPQVNRFRFKDADGTTHITFFPKAPEPIQPNDPPNASQLEYQGPEGQFTFRGNEIDKEASRLGRLVTVTLESGAADAPPLDITLVFPPLNLGDEAQLEFETIAVKAKGRGFVPADLSGALLTYEVLNLVGVAEPVVVAF